MYSVTVHGTDEYSIKFDAPLMVVWAMPADVAEGIGNALVKAAAIVKWGELWKKGDA